MYIHIPGCFFDRTEGGGELILGRQALDFVEQRRGPIGTIVGGVVVVVVVLTGERVEVLDPTGPAELLKVFDAERLVLGLVLLQELQNQPKELDGAGEDDAAGGVAELLLGHRQKGVKYWKLEEPSRDDEATPLLPNIDGEEARRDGPTRGGAAVVLATHGGGMAAEKEQGCQATNDRRQLDDLPPLLYLVQYLVHSSITIERHYAGL